MKKLSCLILAAGSSARMGGPNKLLLPVAGEALVRRTALEVCKEPFQQIIAVTGFDSDKITELLSDLPLTIVHNRQYLSGMHGSLRAGIMALIQPLDGFFVCLSDQPHFDHRVLEKMRLVFADHDGEKIIYPSFQGQRGQPTLIPAKFIPEILNHEDGDHGAVYLFKKYPELTFAVDLEKAEALVDLDTPEDYSGFLKKENN